MTPAKPPASWASTSPAKSGILTPSVTTGWVCAPERRRSSETAKPDGECPRNHLPAPDPRVRARIGEVARRARRYITMSGAA